MKNPAPKSCVEQDILQAHGRKLLDRYMDILSEPAVWRKSCQCCKTGETCLTPVGFYRQMQQDEVVTVNGKRPLMVHVGGSTCVDVSGMGILFAHT